MEIPTAVPKTETTLRLSIVNDSRNKIEAKEVEVITHDDRSILIEHIDTLSDSRPGSIEEIRQRISAVIDDLHEGANKVTDAIGGIMLEALDFARSPYEDSDLDRILQLIAGKVILAMEGTITMGSLFRADGQNPIRHPLPHGRCVSLCCPNNG